MKLTTPATQPAPTLADAVNHATARGDTREAGRIGNLIGAARKGHLGDSLVASVIRAEMGKGTPQPEQEQQEGEPLRTGCICGLRGLSLDMTQEQAESASHAGSCDNDVAYLVARPEIAAQLDAIDPETLAAGLKESGAWEDEELADHEQNRHRAVWLAACDIRENPERETAQEEQEQQETAAPTETKIEGKTPNGYPFTITAKWNGGTEITRSLEWHPHNGVGSILVPMKARGCPFGDLYYELTRNGQASAATAKACFLV